MQEAYLESLDVQLLVGLSRVNGILHEQHVPLHGFVGSKLHWGHVDGQLLQELVMGLHLYRRLVYQWL